MSSLWDSFVNYDNFFLAWERVLNVSSRMIHDKLGLEIFAYNLQANLEDLVRQVNAGDFPYEPLADHKVYVPKASTTLRTMSLMSVPDVIVYQSLANVIADRSQSSLITQENEHVLGNLYAGPNQKWMLKPWKYQYNKFVKRIEQLYKARNHWIASTDIVAFYDTIDHERLLFITQKYCGDDQRFIDLVRKCLSKWSAHNGSVTMSRGVPQGANASDYLANLFLHDIDKEMIRQGYHYVRYVDDIRILGPNKSTVQQGLILFDLELKRAGLVAQVSKTSVHEIEDIDKEINRLRFIVTDPSGGSSPYFLISTPTLPKGEQAESVADYVHKTSTVDNSSSNGRDELSLSEQEDEQEENTETVAGGTDSIETDTDYEGNESLQGQLLDKFNEAYALLDDPDKARQAESTITFCLFRLDPNEDIRDKVLDLLQKLPWRSGAVTKYLSLFKDDEYVASGLIKFIEQHRVYSWHRANALEVLYEVKNTQDVYEICRSWLSDTRTDWYARTIAARILANIPGQHAFFVECFRREQIVSANEDAEATAILRQQLAFGAFQRIRSNKKQLALFDLICRDSSPMLHRLAIYLLQQPKCNVTWEELQEHHEKMGDFSEFITEIGLSANAPKRCFVAQTLSTFYEVSLDTNDLRPFYLNHYDLAVERLRESIIATSRSNDAYVSKFHQFAHLTLIGFYEFSLPAESGLYEGYARLTDRQIFSNTLPLGVDTWKRLGGLRNRVDHPVDKKTQAHTKRITTKEVNLLQKELRVALQELFDVWLNSPPPPSPSATSSTAVTQPQSIAATS